MSSLSPRERIIRLLRRTGRTCDSLAQELDVTPNAVRTQLALMERDGLVAVRMVQRRGVGKPAHVYSLTAAGELHFSRAYVPFLRALLEELAVKLTPAEMSTLLAATGSRLSPPSRSVPMRNDRSSAELLAALLADLGGEVVVEQLADRVEVRSHGCPLAAAVRTQHKVCTSMEALMASAIGMPVTARCDRGARLTCVFELGEPLQEEDASGAT